MGRQVPGCRDEIGDIGGEIRFCEIAFAFSEAREVEAQGRDPFGR